MLSARLASIRARLDALAEDSIRFWGEHGPDREYGGIHGTLDRRGRAVEPSFKGLIQQARHLWTFSMWHARREATAEIRALADSCYRLLIDSFLDRDGEFFYHVTRQGAPLRRNKPIYAQSFAIYALSEYAAVFGVEPAAQAALACFRSVDKRAHDPMHGGYDQSDEQGWTARGATKNNNTQLHMLEALTGLYRATQDALVGERLREMTDLMVQRIAAPDGRCNMDMRADWTPVGPPLFSYGHDIETSWLLREAVVALNGVLGDVNREVQAAALRMGTLVDTHGWDPHHGGFFYAGVAEGAGYRTIDRRKVWWVQAEALPALWWLYKDSGEERYLDRMEALLDWIETRQRDTKYGEWYEEISRWRPLIGRRAYKGHEWKAGYHVLRALVYTSDWIAASGVNATASDPV